MRNSLCAVVAVLVLACGGGSEIPSDVEARSFLGRLVVMAQAGNIDGICAVALCTRDDHIQPLAAPAAPPMVVRTWVLEGTSGAQPTIGGRVLELCGVDRAGQPYRSELLVYRAAGQLRTQAYQYWTNMGVSGGPPVTAPGPPAVEACPT